MTGWLNFGGEYTSRNHVRSCWQRGWWYSQEARPIGDFFHSPRRRNHRPSPGAYQPACRYPTAQGPECDIFGKRSEVSGLTRDGVGEDID